MSELLALLLCAFSVSALPLSYDASVDSNTVQKRWEQGISDDAMIINWIGLGFLPDFDSSSVGKLNSVLPLPMAVVGDYIPISSDDTSLGGFWYHYNDIVGQETKPVYMATIELEYGLYDFASWQADVISQAMKNLNDAGVPVWVRFAYEMNGCPAWNAWGCDAGGFKQAWGIMASSLRYWAPDSKMLWSPNIDTDNNNWGNYDQYYPGDDTVDLVGLSFYSFGINQQENTAPSQNLFTQTAGPFYDTYSAEKGKPFVLSETSAAFHYYTGTEVATSGGASELTIKSQWINQILSWDTHYAFPNMIAAVWFNFVKNEREQTIDYRALLGNWDVQNMVYALKNW
ncbi:glycoside hydrolase family 26 protein [Calocera viscosa TUFC12733]|uniref:Glycoside hydrolase family 26 protein n=1 Tax=Calocera viscosa (strain TUFC12733) TaxID=1330018 RepID=A0A167KXU3_CALVF|nr:glycoside hydrolase family 26 protein [Calocera viscosa TUFC12733]